MEIVEEQMAIPQELIDRDQWVLWKLEEKIDKETGESKINEETGEIEYTKVPYQINGKKAVSTVSSTWTSHEKVLRVYKNSNKYNGVGYVLTEDDSYTVIDLDDCIKDGKISPEALTIVRALNSYTEYSQSGEGLHIIIKAKKPGSRCKKSKKGIEMYDKEHFIVMTGDHLSGIPSSIEERQAQLTKMYNHYFPEKNVAKPLKTAASKDMSDEDILSIAFHARNGDKIKALYQGNWSEYGSQSEADQAFCNYIAFYTQQASQIDRIFTNSGLYREKWDRNDYKSNTIQNAIQGLTSTYQSKQDVKEMNIANIAKSVTIPKPFKIINGSLYTIKKAKSENGDDQQIFVSRHVPVLTKEFHNVERPQVLYEITWNQGNGTINEVVPASTIAVRRELLELSEKGFSVNDNNVKNLISFMDFYLLENDIDKHYAVERLGKIKDTFVHPVLANDIEIMAIDQGEKQLLEGFEIKGTSESWKQEVFERIKDQPKAVFMVLASFASVIIKDLGIKPFIVELNGNSSQGKTTTLEIASSVWGNKNLVSEWNATKVSIERKAAYLNSYPLFVDDTRKADERVLQSIIYQFSGGRSKGRGSLKGSQRENTWNNILLSTGEVSLNDYTKNAGGAAARVISLGDEPLKNDLENVISLQGAIQENYGAIGIEFLGTWFEHKKNVIKDFPKVRNFYTEKAKGKNVISRLAEFYAAVHFTGLILKDYMNMDVDLGDLSNLFNDMVQENKSVDKPMQFLEGVLTDLDSSRQDIFYNHEPQFNKAIYKDGHLYLMPAYLKEYLGIEVRQTRNEWKKRGITVEHKEKNGTYVDYTSVSKKGKTYRGVLVNMARVEELGFNFDDKS